MGRRGFIGMAFACAALLGGCANLDTTPINLVASQAPPASPLYIADSGDDGSTVVALSFSGGGMRAAAFSYGVLRALDDIVVDQEPYRRTMVDNIRMISGVSGGSIVAAYFGYKGRDGYRDLDRRFLYQNPESVMRLSASPLTLARALSGGVNDRSSFARWLDANLFDHADFSRFRSPDAPTVWINASDIYQRTPFLFTYDTFAALCSDLDSVRISDAVAASAAFPVVFAPVVLQAKRSQCSYRQPDWLKRALADGEHSVRLQAYAQALDAYQRNANLNYIRLLDGGLTDNLGITGFVLERAAADSPHGPLSPDEAVKLRRFIFVVADSGRGQTETWARDNASLPIRKLLTAAIDTGMSASLRDEVDALRLAVARWREELIAYRCSLSSDRIRRIRGTTAGWNCRDVQAIVEHLSFADLGPVRALELSAVPTRLSLPAGQVDSLVEAGREAVHRNKRIAEAVSEMRKQAGINERPLVADR